MYRTLYHMGISSVIFGSKYDERELFVLHKPYQREPSPILSEQKNYRHHNEKRNVDKSSLVQINSDGNEVHSKIIT